SLRSSAGNWQARRMSLARICTRSARRRRSNNAFARFLPTRIRRKSNAASKSCFATSLRHRCLMSGTARSFDCLSFAIPRSFSTVAVTGRVHARKLIVSLTPACSDEGRSPQHHDRAKARRSRSVVGPKCNGLVVLPSRLDERRSPGRPLPHRIAGDCSEEKRGPAMKLVGPLAARSPELWLALALEIERHCSADEILQGHLIDLVAFVDVDGAPDIPLEAGVE